MNRLHFPGMLQEPLFVWIWSVIPGCSPKSLNYNWKSIINDTYAYWRLQTFDWIAELDLQVHEEPGNLTQSKMAAHCLYILQWILKFRL